MLGRVRTFLKHRGARLLGRRPQPFALERGIVSFTFDDFPKSAWTAGGAILERHGARGSFYVCARNAGTDFEGVRQFDDADVAALLANGHELGCHTAAHGALPTLDEASIAAQLAENAAFAKRHGATLSTFAYPFGDVSLRSKRFVSQHFDSCRGVWAGLNEHEVDLALLNCVCLEPHILARKDAASWIAEAAARKAWLVFLTHDVAENPTPYGVTPEALEAVVAAAAQSGCELLPVRDALKRVRAGAPEAAAA